jgi:hypothetical protein
MTMSSSHQGPLRSERTMKATRLSDAMVDLGRIQAIRREVQVL